MKYYLHLTDVPGDTGTPIDVDTLEEALVRAEEMIVDVFPDFNDEPYEVHWKITGDDFAEVVAKGAVPIGCD